MSHAIASTLFVAQRHLRALARQPWFVGIALVQPMIWLLLFGALFRRVADLPGFSSSYVDYLTPGVVVMTALFSSGWTGMSVLDDLERGTLDRMLATPVARGALLHGIVLEQVVVVAIQSLLVLAVAVAAGARLPGLLGSLGLVAAACLLGAAFSGLSNGLALLMRRRESLIGMVQFLVLPCTFLSTALMPAGLLPGWMDKVTLANPVDWAVRAARAAMSGDIGSPGALWRLAALAALAGLAALFSARAVRLYQRNS